MSKLNGGNKPEKLTKFRIGSTRYVVVWDKFRRLTKRGVILNYGFAIPEKEYVQRRAK